MQCQLHTSIFKLNAAYQTFRKPPFNIEDEKWFISAEIHFTVDDKQNIFLSVLQKNTLHMQYDSLPGFVA